MSTPLSTETLPKSFCFGATIKARSAFYKIDALGELLPGVSTITLVSRSFLSYDECVSSCRQLMDDVTDRLNEASAGIFKLGSEVNPLYSGSPTLSKDWAPGEVARLWIYDQSMEKSGQIAAMGQARIFGSTISIVDHLN